MSIAESLLFRDIDPFNFVLSYKFSQDHIELLFSCIRARGGYNNNPNTLQFRTSLKQILMKNSISPSTSANVLSFEDAYNGSIFTLKSSKRQSPAAELLISNECTRTDDDEEVMKLFSVVSTSTFQDNVLYSTLLVTV